MEMLDMIHRLIAWRCAMSRHLIVLVGAPVCLCVTALTLGCSSAGTADAVEKAQIAVRANPSLELVATDERQGVLTVRVKRSGQMLTVSAGDVVAGNAFRDLDAGSGGARTSGGGNASGSRVTVATPEGQVSVGRSGPGVDVSTSEGRVSVRRSGDGGIGVSTSEGQVGVRRSGDGVAVSTPEGQVSVRRSGDGVSVSTPEGQVNVGGSGVAVQSESRRRESSDRPSSSNGGNGSGAPSSDSSGRGAVIDESRLERRTRPVFCKGDNSIDLIDVLLRVEDVAVETLGSCVVHIRNSHIVGNVAVQSTGGTTVTIENSIIEGRVALALKGSVMVSVQSSTIRGAVQRVGATNLRDLGGNLWR